MRERVDEALGRGLEKVEGACDLLAVGGEVHERCLIVSGDYTYRVQVRRRRRRALRRWLFSGASLFLG